MSPRTIKQNQSIRDKSRKNISEAALMVFAEEGYHSASVSKIASRAGVSKGLMYNYFKSKEELIRGLLLDVLSEAESKIGLPQDRPLADKDVKVFIKESFAFIQQNPHRWKLFFSIYIQKEVMELMREEMMQRANTFVNPFIEYFTSKGLKDPEVMTRYFHATIDGVQMQLMMDPEHFPAKQVRKLILKQFVK